MWPRIGKLNIRVLRGLDFTQGKSSPCVFRCKSRDLSVVIHGDDFTLLGPHDQLNWFTLQLSDKFQVKMRGIMGPDEGDVKEMRLLNRIVRWLPDGIRYEADQRHAEILIQQLGLGGQSRSAHLGSKNPATTSPNLCQKQMCPRIGLWWPGSTISLKIDPI